VSLDADEVAAGKPMLDLNVAVLGPSERRKSLTKRRDARLYFWIILGECMQKHDAPHPLRLLRALHERPCRPRAAEKRG
jgi:hypothetical protein